MTTLISTPGVKRSASCGFSNYQALGEQAGLAEQDMLVIEPAFLNYADATNEQLSSVFSIGQGLDVKPKFVVVNIAYSRPNANVFKGYLLDVVDFYKSLGYAHFTSTHVPYEAYGVPMVGSTLPLMFGQVNFAYVPEKKVTYPAEAFPDMLYHAPNGRSSGSIYAGTALMDGYLRSSNAFLPDINQWPKANLRCEYRNWDTTTPETIRLADVHALFGVTEYGTPADLQLCTPPAILQSFLNIKEL